MAIQKPTFCTPAGDTFYHWYTSPVGRLLLAGGDEALYSISFPRNKILPAAHWHEQKKPFKDVCRQLDHYFNGKLNQFELQLAPSGTDFQKQVWQELLKIPYGATQSYSDIARSIKNPKAVRAVGGANGRNPISIVVPCHRVIGSNGTLTGFGGGLPTKTFLLDLENQGQLALPLQ